MNRIAHTLSLHISHIQTHTQKLTSGQTNGTTNAINNNGYGNGNQAQSQYSQPQTAPPVAPPPPPFNSGYYTKKNNLFHNGCNIVQTHQHRFHTEYI